MTNNAARLKIRDEFMIAYGAAMASKEHRTKLAKVMAHVDSLPDGDCRAWWQALEKAKPELLANCCEHMTGFRPSSGEQTPTQATLDEIRDDLTFRLNKRTKAREIVTNGFANQLEQRKR